MQFNQRKAYTYALLAVTFWSTVATAFKFALRNLQYYEVLLYSTLFSFISLLIVLISQGRFREIFRMSLKEILLSAMMGFLNPFLYYFLLFTAYSLLPAQEALTLNYVWALMLVLLSLVFLKQKISIFSFVALLISFLGVVVIASHGNLRELKFSNELGVVLALSSSVVWAAYWIFNLKDKREEVIKLCLNFFFGFLYSMVFVLFFKSGNIQFNNGVYFTVYIGLFEMGITFIVWLKALKFSETTARVSNLVYLSPFLSLFFISFFLREKILISTVIGLALIVLGILLQQRKSK